MLKYFIIVAFIFVNQQTIAQSTSKKAKRELDLRGELYIKFDTRKFNPVHYGDFLSLDHKIVGNFQYAYLNFDQFKHLSQIGFEYDIEVPPSLQKEVSMATSTNDITTWDKYPTYEQYVEYMEYLATKYPNLCKLEDFGETLKGRRLLALKISDNVEQEEAEPNFLYTSSMHGDEITGYVLMLRLATYLLDNYSDEKIRYLVDNTEIWINPLSNPDGTYAAGNTTVNGATRNNAATHLTSSTGSAGVDLNRNFPDGRIGEAPDGNDLQPENTAMISFMKKHNFVLAANFHGGAEVVNYPWDTWFHLHADDLWYQHLSRQYVDTVHKYAEQGYMNFANNGITNGAAWYQVAGGRQDYTNYFLHGREVTIEISDTKLPEGSQLLKYWNYNYRSFLHYIEQAHYGVRGIITDADTGKPLEAMVEVIDHDADNSQVFSHDINGNYHRFLTPNTYTIRYTKEGYAPKTIRDVNVVANKATVINVELMPLKTSVETLALSSIQVFPNPITQFSQLTFQLSEPRLSQVSITNLEGKAYYSNSDLLQVGTHTIDFSHVKLPSGVYLCCVRLGKSSKNIKLLVQ